jgi:shikimate kinase
MNIVLFGFMAVGKTTIGKLLAEHTGYRFVDVDEEIALRTGREIKEIFESDGEAAFREIEKHVIKDLSDGDKQIIACGGGAVLDPENVANLRRCSRLLLLTADLTEIIERTIRGESRPLLNVEDRRATIENLLRDRMPVYLKIADKRIDTSCLTPRQVVAKITRNLEDLP